MKKILTLTLIMFVFFVGKAQLPVDATTKKITFSEVVTAEGLTSTELYKMAGKWGLGKGYTVKNKSETTIVFSASLPVKYNSVQRGGTESGTVNFEVSILCKDGRYKYKMTNFVHNARHANCGALESEKSACTKYQILPGSWQAVKDQTKTEVEKIIKELQASLKKAEAAPVSTDDDNW